MKKNYIYYTSYILNETITIYYSDPTDLSSVKTEIDCEFVKLLTDEWLSKVREIFEILPKPRSQIIFKGKYALSEVVKLSNIRNDSSKSLYEIK